MSSPQPSSLPEGSSALDTMVVKSEGEPMSIESMMVKSEESPSTAVETVGPEHSENPQMQTETKCEVMEESDKEEREIEEGKKDDVALEESSEPIDLTVVPNVDRMEEKKEEDKEEVVKEEPMEEPMEVDKREVFAVPELPIKSEVDPVVERLKKEINCAIKVYQKYFEDMNLAHKVSQPNISKYTRDVMLQKMNASTVHIDGYNTRIEMAKTAEQLQSLLEEIRAQNRKARQSQEINAFLGDPF